MDWEWFSDPNTFSVFIYLLLQANFEDRKYKGLLIKRGQVMTGIRVISDKTGVSIRSVRTAITRLESTHEVTRQRHSNFTVISILNYDQYQMTDTVIANRATQQRHNNKNEKNDKKYKNTIETPPENFKYEKIKDLFNALCGEALPKVKMLSDKRKSSLRMMSKFLQSEDDWADYFSRVNQSCFLSGENNQGWRADFDWLTNQNNYLKVIEGKYDNKNGRITESEYTRKMLALFTADE
jgi:hypothetical protein